MKHPIKLYKLKAFHLERYIRIGDGTKPAFFIKNQVVCHLLPSLQPLVASRINLAISFG